MTTQWGGGYVTDIEYTASYFPAQSPAMLALACLVNGIAVDPPWDAPGQHYLELGCGRGLNACVMAAANPDWRVTGIDFMPGAIAEARALAAEAGLGNVAFIEADLAGFAETPEAAALPMADMVTAHGLWTWVSDAVRAGIVRLLTARLRAGGLFHVSYNALPAQQALLALQRVLRESGRRLASRSDRQAIAGRDTVKALAAAGAMHLTSTDVVREWLAKIDSLPVAYLAHEYMNDHWRPCYHAEVAEALGAARLDYAGSARLTDNFLDLMLSPAQRELHDRFDDPVMRELIADTCLNRTLRHDVFVRGARRLPPAARDAEIARMPVALAVAPGDFRYVLEMPVGEARIGEGYRDRVAALTGGPCSLGALAGAGGASAGAANLAEIAMVMVGTSQALALRAPGAAPDAGVARLNAALARRQAQGGNLNALAVLASPRVGAGVPSRAAEVLLVAEAGTSGTLPEPAAFAASLMPEAPPDRREELAGILARVMRDREAVWRGLGLL